MLEFGLIYLIFSLNEIGAFKVSKIDSAKFWLSGINDTAKFWLSGANYTAESWR